MTRTLLLLGPALTLLGLGGLLLYVNEFSETERDGGGVVLTGSWIVFAAGFVAFAAGLLKAAATRR